MSIALAYYSLGRKPESDSALSELIAKFQKESPYQIAEIHAYRGEIDRAFEWLDRAYAEHDGGFTLLKGDPLLKHLEPDPRLSKLIKKLGLPN